MLRPRPRPVKQQQECITEKNFCCNTHVCYQKITWCKNVKKVMTSHIWHCFRTYCTKEHRYLLHFNIIMSHSVWSCTTVLKARQKYKTKTKTKAKAARPRPRPRLVWDRSCHKNAVSDPKTAGWPNIMSAIESAHLTDSSEFVTGISVASYGALGHAPPRLPTF